MMSVQEESISALLSDPSIGQLFDRFFRQVVASTYEDFANNVELDLEFLFTHMERGASIRKNDGEDRLTEELLLGLKARGYSASHDEYINGHSDIVVKSRYHSYIWLGEAKIHSSYEWLLDGFSQLCERYSTGTVDDRRGGLVIYIRNANAKSVLDTWSETLQEHFRSQGLVIDVKADEKNPLRLKSVHKHQKSGLDYEVKHFGVVMHFNPRK